MRPIGFAFDEFADADVAVIDVMDDAGLEALDANEGEAAEDALRAEKFGEAVFVSQAVLHGEDLSGVFEERGDERFELIVGGGFEGDDDEVGFGHSFGLVVDVHGAGRKGEIAVATADGPATPGDGGVIAAEEEVDIVAVLGESAAVVCADRAGADDGDEGIGGKHGGGIIAGSTLSGFGSLESALRITGEAPVPQKGNMNLQQADPKIAELIKLEEKRQESTLELIASENHVSRAVQEAAGTVLTNKYAEGYPGARYYGGCAYYDEIETIAIDRAKQLFGARFANVQPHSGANANLAAFMAMMQPGDRFISINLSSGGHLSHGMKLNTSAIFYKPDHYELDPKTETIDFNSVRAKAKEIRPKMILCGYSAYPRTIDFAQFRAIADEVGAMLLADVAHIAGLCVTGVHPSPFPHSHVVTTTTHKTLRGPRGGLILTNDEELAKAINRSVFPGSQGGPLMHIVAAKAVGFGEALRPEFKTYSQQIVKNAKALASALQKKGYRLQSGGTDNHLMLVDLRARNANFTGADAEKALEAAGVITNKNAILNDPRPPKVTSGLRLGTPAVTTRGLKEQEMETVAEFIDRGLHAKDDAGALAKIKGEVAEFCKRFPMPH